MKKLLPLLLIPFLVFSSCKKDKLGCTEPTACNYDENANKNDGTCISATTWYQDLDGDTLGNPYEILIACTQPSGYVSNNADTSGTFDLLVVKKQRATVTYVGATWCPPCGAYGDPTKEHMESTFGNDVVILNVQYEDAISSAGEFGPPFGGVFQQFVNTNGIPHIYFSGANIALTDSTNHRGFSSSNSYNASAADANINAILSDFDVSVGVAASAVITGSTVTVETLTKFYSNQAVHYIGVYLLEDGVMASQSISGSDNAITAHNNVIRTSAYDGNTLGAQSIGASFTANEEVSGTYSISVKDGWNVENLQAAVVIWNSTNPDGISNSVIVDVN